MSSAELGLGTDGVAVVAICVERPPSTPQVKPRRSASDTAIFEFSSEKGIVLNSKEEVSVL